MKNKISKNWTKLFALCIIVLFSSSVSAIGLDLYVSGIVTNSAANGRYNYLGLHPPDNKKYWKHETEEYYIYYCQYLSTGTYNWNIDADMDSTLVLFYSNVDPDDTSPVNVISWTGDTGTGSPVVTDYNYGTSVPTVVTSDISFINATSVTMGGNVVQEGLDAVSERGVVYSSTNSTPEISGIDVTQDLNGAGLGIFSKSIGLLTNGTLYYFQAYATNSAGPAYGGVIAVTPGVIDFELTGYDDGLELGQTVDIHGFTFVITSSEAGDNIIFDDEDPAGNGTGALWDDNINPGDITRWSISKTDGSEFQLKSLYLKQGGAGSTSGTVSAFKDGSQIGSSVAVNFDGNKSYLNEPGFNNLDEIRIEAADLYLFVDSLLFGVPVLTARFIGPGTDFNVAANWESGSVPSDSLDIIIAAGQTMEVNEDYTCKTLQFENGASFHCNGDKKLTITGNILNRLGEVAIEVISSLVVSSSITINNPPLSPP